MNWISVKDKPPPKHERFLAKTERGIEMMSWFKESENRGWYSLCSGCSCCSGYCSLDFEYWMPLSEPPKELNGT